MKTTKKILVLILFFILCLVIPSCKEKTIHEFTVSEQVEFGNVYLNVTIEDFLSLGFSLGDSLNLKFSNGYEINDVPFYDGYYNNKHQAVVVAYPGYPYICFSINGGSAWYDCELTESDKAIVTINKKEKYINIQNNYNIKYTNNREDYETDEIFANFRPLTGGRLKKDIIYRSASPIDNSYNRATFTNKLIEEKNISYILDLADNLEKLEGYLLHLDYDAHYYMKLYRENKVGLLGLKYNYETVEYGTKLAAGLVEMIKHEGPYLVHCTEGKDRTGFVCILLEALAGATFEEIQNDYMITYYNYYGIDKKTDEEKYNMFSDLKLLAMLNFILDVEFVESYENIDFVIPAKTYLSKYMNNEDIEKLCNILCEN